ncbi:hypothetical protein L7F22_035775 [Adiantum nelumboides]|nr:hypothetical protein [Adiantum nelumboides]
MVKRAIDRMRTGKAYDRDGLVAEHFIHARDMLVELLAVLFNRVMCEGLLETWRLSTIVPIFKAGDSSKPRNYHTIMVGHTLARLSRDKKEDKTDAQDSKKGKEKANVASSVIIEELSDVEDILCVTMSADDTHDYDASLNVHTQEMSITKGDLIDALLTANDALSQTWIIDSVSGSSEGISIHAVFVTRETGEALSKYADDSRSKVWIVPSFENTVWSVMVFSLISLLAVGAFLVTWYIVRRHRQRRLGGRLLRHDEHCVMSIRIVQAMPSATYRVVGNEKAAQESCVICQEEYINGEQMRILPCSHRFHCSCVDAWLTMWRAVCPICKRDARYEFPDLQVSERSPLLSFSSGGGRGSYGTKEESSSGSPPIQIPPSYPDSQMGFLDIPSCSKGTAASCSRFIPSSLSNSLLFRRSSALDGSLEAFRASPYFTPPSLSQNTSPLLPGSYAAPYLLDCSPVVGSPSSFSSGPRNTWSKSFLNPGKVSRASSAAGSFSPHSCGSRNVS